MIKRIHGLLIGDFQAATWKNDEGVTYIALAPLNEDVEEKTIGIDEIEARALYEWLGRALSLSDPTPAEPK
jgi:hypothetical protein